MRAEFEEKTFENYFNSELVQITGSIPFAPGQVAEAILGFDAAFFWPMADFPPWSHAHLFRPDRMSAGIALKELDRFGQRLSKTLPSFALNLFVQYKRPDFLSTRNAREWGDWERPYFRYQITPHQQTQLETLQLDAGSRAAVVYVAPSFWKSDDLHNKALGSGIIANSNVVNIKHLEGHHRYSYCAPGNEGLAHSEPVKVVSDSLEEILSGGNKLEALPFNRHLKETAKTIDSAVTKNGDRVQFNLTKKALRYRLGLLEEELQPQSFSSALITIVAFLEINNVSLFTIPAGR